jgi:glycerol transport system ATP-binding protein
MARIELRGIAHNYSRPRTPAVDEAEYALKPLDLVWDHGGAYALLGPSGCGKSTLLGIMSGLIKPTRGAVLIDDRDVTTLSARERNVAQVFQFPVIYDTMTVFDNLAFPLRNRGVARAEVNTRVGHVAELLELTSELGRRASGLPGELKQRISLGRGLVRNDVAAILLDEPLTVIDPHLKWQLRRKLVEIHRELNLTLIYVTHDQLEALTLADRVVVMSDGRVLQQGTPEMLFERPEHVFVGHFIGSPGMNIVPCTWQPDGVRIAGQRVRCEVPPGITAMSEPLQLGVRPEYLRLLHTRGIDTPAARVTQHVQLGGTAVVSVELAGQLLHVRTEPDARWQVGDPCYVEFSSTHARLYRDGRLLEA